jgi:hypothetical protein
LIVGFFAGKTSSQAIFFFPPNAFSTAASNTRREAFQMSRPVPSPSMNGIMSWSGTWNSSPTYSITCPCDGTGTPL